MIAHKKMIEIIWFKRDLRLVDHQPFASACQSAIENNHLILPVYFVEPDLWQAKDASHRHWNFIYDSLVELNFALQQHQQPLHTLFGNAVDCLQNLQEKYIIKNIWSHQETGNRISYQRDQAVQLFCQHNGISWNEYPQHAIQRGKLDRDQYYSVIKSYFDCQPIPEPTYQQPLTLEQQDALLIEKIQDNPYLENNTNNLQIQTGGRTQALALLESFTSHRYKKYLICLAKPLGGDLFSSRLSAHLAYGTLSNRELLYALRLEAQQSPNRNLSACQQRLMWQSHFMQKLESEPEIEFHCMHPAYENIRPWDKQAQHYFVAWRDGLTGFPMIDACMRCLQKTGWLPFRMRALVMSFASYQLWIPWQKSAALLATLFTDYEPGIHYAQAQMQSGTTGINAIRIYNPVKQSQDHDPNGAFIRRWCPELSQLNNEDIHTPWKRDLLSIDGQLDYPPPIIDLDQATREAKEKIYKIKRNVENRSLGQKVFLRHGSRSSPSQRPGSKTKNKRSRKKDFHSNEQQLSLF